MAQQKLYTEEQVKEAMLKYTSGSTPTMVQVFDSLTPIELPSDEEIEYELAFPNELMNEVTYMFIEGAKWMRDKLLTK